MKQLTLTLPILFMSACQALQEDYASLVWTKDLSRSEREPLRVDKRSSIEAERGDDDVIGDTTQKRQAVLQRMPLSYGKRTPGSEAEIPEDISIRASGNRALLGRMPLNYSKRTPRSRLEIPEDVSLQPSGKRALLDRMPLSYGKRNPELLALRDGDFDPANGEKRAVLDRMPLSFGKRTSSSESSRTIRSEFDKKRAVLERMPIHFGKRGSKLGHTEIDMNERFDNKRSLLDRMPISYGKRLSRLETTFGSGSSVKRAVLDRMPLNFGKRVTSRKSTTAEDVRLDASLKRALLDRMPLSYGKRSDIVDDEGGWVDDKRSMLHRMAMRYGGLANPRFSRRDWRLNWKRAALLDRMPLSFGKRDYLGSFLPVTRR